MRWWDVMFLDLFAVSISAKTLGNMNLELENQVSVTRVWHCSNVNNDLACISSRHLNWNIIVSRFSTVNRFWIFLIDLFLKFYLFTPPSTYLTLDFIFIVEGPVVMVWVLNILYVQGLNLNEPTARRPAFGWLLAVASGKQIWMSTQHAVQFRPVYYVLDVIKWIYDLGEVHFDG